ncbi:MAG: IS701 family transposase [Deltaproteobacteria bacterium]|jgi:SRSO17 transposase
MDLDGDVTKRLEAYLGDIGEILKYPKRKAAFATYVVGLFSMVERKTAEGLAALSVPDPNRADAEHQRLLHVIGQSRWSDRNVRRHAAKYALDSIASTGKVESWIIDDTGWLKKGNHSVGVQRQYTGTSGKVDNCQLGVTLAAATRDWQLPLDFELYLPETWIEDEARRLEAKIPTDRRFKTKEELALEMIDRAVADNLPRPKIALADSFYGRSCGFRAAVRAHQIHYGVGVRRDIKVRRIDSKGTLRGPVTTASAIAKKVQFRRVKWTDGSDGDLSSHFAFVRVVPQADLKADPSAESVWLVIERAHDDEPCKYLLCSMPKTTPRRELVRLLHQRWRIERVYQDMKQEFGLDQYQGRSFVGWHHHVSAAMVGYAFAVAEQARLFPPGALSLAETRPTFVRPAATPFRRVDGHHSARDTAANSTLVTALSVLPTTDAETGRVRLRSNVTQ